MWPHPTDGSSKRWHGHYWTHCSSLSLVTPAIVSHIDFHGPAARLISHGQRTLRQLHWQQDCRRAKNKMSQNVCTPLWTQNGCLWISRFDGSEKGDNLNCFSVFFVFFLSWIFFLFSIVFYGFVFFMFFCHFFCALLGRFFLHFVKEMDYFFCSSQDDMKPKYIKSCRLRGSFPTCRLWVKCYFF